MTAHAHAPIHDLGTRTPLPTEQERYLDMLLMVREAMIVVIGWYDRNRRPIHRVPRRSTIPNLERASEVADMCRGEIDGLLGGDDESPFGGGDRAAFSGGQVWLQYEEDLDSMREARRAQREVSKIIAAFAN